MKISILFVLALSTGCAVSAQVNLSLDQAREDYNIFRRALETTYPSMYRYTDSATITKYFDEQFNQISDNESTLSLYRRIAYACAKMNDEHLIPTPPTWYYDSLKSSKHYFPFSIKLRKRRMYVLRGSHLPSAFPVGSEIISINGRSVEELLNILLPAIPSDGYIETFDLRHMEDYSMTQNENLFDLNYPIFVEDVDTFHLKIIPPGKKSIRSVTITGLSHDQYKQFYGSRRQWHAPLHFTFLRDTVGYLKIESFHRGSRDAFSQNFEQLYDSIFTLLDEKKTQHLILDLRNNEGGDDTGQKLLLYLLTQPSRVRQ